MIDPSYAVQKAVYQALDTAGLSGVGIHDVVTQGKPLPYLIYGENLIIPDEEQAGPYRWFDAYVEVQVIAKTKLQCLQITSAVIAALGVPIPMDAPVSCHRAILEKSMSLGSRDGVFTQVIEMRYRVQTG